MLCFNYPKYHSMGYERPNEYIPERWSSLSKHKENYIPFGMLFSIHTRAHSFVFLYVLKTLSFALPSRRYPLESPLPWTEDRPRFHEGNFKVYGSASQHILFHYAQSVSSVPWTLHHCQEAQPNQKPFCQCGAIETGTVRFQCLQL